MPNVGALAANFHEGSRSEYLAQYIFASFGTAVPVPHQEDMGVDLYCTITERIGRLAWPKQHYTVQIKSTLTPWTFATPESVRWLVQHPLPLLLCTVDKPTCRIRLYHTLPRYLAWVSGDLPDSLELVPEDSREGKSTQWQDGKSFSLSAPILDYTVTELQDDQAWTQALSVLDSWLSVDQSNLARLTASLPVFSMPYDYRTNETWSSGTVFQSNTFPERVDQIRKPLGEQLGWLADAFWRQDDLRGMARAVILLRYLYPEYIDRFMPDAKFAQQAVNTALGLEASYVYEGVDLLSQSLDEIIAQLQDKNAGDST